MSFFPKILRQKWQMFLTYPLETFGGQMSPAWVEEWVIQISLSTIAYDQDL